MKKIIYSFLLGIALISHSLYAGMEKSDQCKREITRLFAEIKGLEKKNTRLNELIKDKGRWKSFPLIPEFVLTWKLKTLEQAIKNLQEENIKDQIQIKKQELESRQNRLKSPTSIRIREITVKASGEWDRWKGAEAPDIKICLGNAQFGPIRDTWNHTFSLEEDVTHKISLEIRDDDPIGYDSMAVVELEKFGNCKGVEGDWFTQVLRGKNDKGNNRITKYEITYEVNF